MSYQVLARKWRPKNFPEMVGQVHVLKALINALDNDRLHHAYLFTGTRGVGKTTVARILAKSLNCLEGVSSNPCGVCAACQEIDEGRFVDLIEVDAASKTKVEDTRELLENVQYSPTCGRYKVYLIDEVHMLSTHSFNALLKTLEEPPAHVKFLLATTDPQKLPATVLSRCLQFNLKCLPVEQIVEHQINILQKEGVEFEKGALIQIARAAEGSMRDSLSLLDQAIAFGGGKLQETEVQAMLGTIAQSYVYDLLEFIFNSDAEGLLAKIGEIAGFTPDYSEILAEMINALHRISLAQLVPNAIDDNLGDKEQVLKLSQQISAADLQLYYQIALMGRKDLPFSPEPRTGFEMIMLRMLAFRPVAGRQPVSNGNSEAGVRSQPVTQNRSQSSVSPVQMNQGANPAAAVMASLQNQSAEKKTEFEIESALESKSKIEITQELKSESEPVVSSVSEPVAEPEQQKKSGISAVLAALKNRGAIGKAKEQKTVDKSAAINNSDTNNNLQPDFKYVEGGGPMAQISEPLAVESKPINNSVVSIEPKTQLVSAEISSKKIAETVNERDESSSNSQDMATEYMQYAQMDDYQPAYQNDSEIDLADCGIDAPSSSQLEETKQERPVFNQVNPEAVPESQPSSVQKLVPMSAVGSRWNDIISQLNISGIVSQLAQNCTLIKQTKDELVLKLEETFSNLLNPTNKEKLSLALNQYFGVSVKLQIDLGVNEQDTPAMLYKKEEICRQQQAEQLIMNDPVVKSMQAVFGAEVQAGSVQPV